MENNYSQMKKLERIIVLCMFAFVIVAAITVYSFIVRGKARYENEKYNEFVASLELKQSNLEKSIYDMDNDKYIEQQARNQLGMLKDGEIQYIFD